jgi:serpin B
VSGFPISQDSVPVAASDLSRASVSAPRADILSAAGAINAFGADLYKVLADSAHKGNLVFAPASIELALAMTYAGAAGDTAAQMAKILHFSLQGDALHQAFKSLDVLLQSRNWQGKNAQGKDEGVLVKTANSLWAQKDLAIEKPFLDALATDYGAGVRLVDYRTAVEVARKAINDWVAGETEGKIKDLITEGALGELTRLVLVNAVYFDASWASQFDKDATSKGNFTTLAGSTVTTKLMRQSGRFMYGQGNGWQTVELPYSRNELTMLLIVPDKGRFAEVEARVKSGLVGQAVAALAATRVELSMPKFEFRSRAALADALKALGMQKAFDDKTADFSGITMQEPLWIDEVIHEAFITVDEEGTEAGAATAVYGITVGVPVRSLQLTIDRPFLFVVRDKDSGAVLFFGRVTDPRASGDVTEEKMTESIDVRETQVRKAIAVLAVDEALLARIRSTGVPWWDVQKKLASALPEVMPWEERRQLAYSIVSRALSEVLGAQGDRWHTEKMPRVDGSGVTTWVRSP